VASGWSVEFARGSAEDLLQRPIGPGRTVRTNEVLDDAVVLGSRQPESDLCGDAARRCGLSVVRRRSGGGAVVLQRESHVWIDVFVPRGDPLWDDDVERSAWWVGEWWSAVCGEGATVHRSSLVDRALGSVICFASTGPGEVLDQRCRKVVGISQRRTRSGARFQTIAHLRWDPPLVVDLVADPDLRRILAPVLEHRVGPVGGGNGGLSGVADGLIEQLIGGLPL